MKINLYAYYGALVNRSEITSHMVQINETDLYTFILGKGLQYRPYDKIGLPTQIVVGQELYGNFTDMIFNLTVDNGKPCVADKNGNVITKISSDKEQDIRMKLLSIGVYEEPRYYIFANWEA